MEVDVQVPPAAPMEGIEVDTTPTRPEIQKMETPKPTEEELQAKEKTEDIIPEVNCGHCKTETTVPVIDCKIESITPKAKGVIDTAAVITVLARSRQLPEAKLRLKGITSHKAKLYGPKMTKFVIAGKEFNTLAYEADIEENILGIDFLDEHDAVIKVRKREMTLGSDCNVKLQMATSKCAKLYTAGSVYYTVRADQHVVLKPFMDFTLAAKLKVDQVTDELIPTEDNSELIPESFSTLDSETVTTCKSNKASCSGLSNPASSTERWNKWTESKLARNGITVMRTEAKEKGKERSECVQKTRKV